MNSSSTLLSIFILTSSWSVAQDTATDSSIFGKPHPDAPNEIRDYQQLIGTCNCQSYSRNPDKSWAEPVDMTWTFKYIMDGMAVQDETIKEDGKHSGSIRQFHPDSARWYVHYYSSAAPTASLATWEGGMENDEIILYRPQKAPNGMDGFYKIRFHDINDSGFKWVGAWVSPDERFVYETWKIDCKR
ncbi:hypothetical protein [Marinoscillum sp.]|uniref:hypothetical protein n=1 Tax=Marinoscillum sp. TaxID=2024838 RepID=UPI003BA92C12